MLRFLHHFSSQQVEYAIRLIAERKVLSVEFSDGTYQVEVMDPEDKQSYWPFLQLDEHGSVLDCFCDCPSQEPGQKCAHLAAAYLIVCDEEKEPWHVRFKSSLWNVLSLIACGRHGYDETVLEGNDKEGYSAFSSGRRALFYIKGLTPKGKKKIRQILLERTEQTESNSLKFSNLTPHELSLWREGRPSPALRYELSFWSDLAKWWMQQYEWDKKIHIDFTYSDNLEEKFPKWIEIKLSDCEIGVYLALANYPALIPALSDLPSPLKVSEFPSKIVQEIVYDQQKKALIIVGKEAKLDLSQAPAMEIGTWMYIDRQGFFPLQTDPLLEKTVITGQEISEFFDAYPKIVRKYLKKYAIEWKPKKAQYHLEMLKNHALKISLYVDAIHDLENLNSAFFGKWAYLEAQGFLALEDVVFPSVVTIIEKKAISDFVNKYKAYLNRFDQFQIHISGLESTLKYKFNADRSLEFYAYAESTKDSDEIIDYGDWIYVKGRGFYAKTGIIRGQKIQPGLIIAPEKISTFIHQHKVELEGIKGFFTPRSPLEKAGIHITLTDKNLIRIVPEYVYRAGLSAQHVTFIGDYAYVENEGFALIPAHCQFPYDYQTEKIIPKANEGVFISYELDPLKPKVLSIDKRLTKADKVLLRLKSLMGPEQTHDLWYVSFDYETNLGSCSLREIYDAIQAKKSYLFSEAGLVNLKHLKFGWLRDVPLQDWVEKNTLRLATLDLLYITTIEKIGLVEGKGEEGVMMNQIFEDFLKLKVKTPPVLTGLKSQLRPYQQVGLEWLWFLYSYRLSGLLCDEMGLGKTHQAMAMIAAAYNSKKRKKPRFLVVCPTSVMYHWENLLQNFFPKIKVCLYHGPNRSFEVFLKSKQLLLTSYGTLRGDIELIASNQFEIAIFDEIHTGKNTQSQLHKALREIKAHMKLGLTGTPLENRVGDLQALFDIILPDFRPFRSLFRDMFASYDKQPAYEKKEGLAKIIKPFILRRKKEEVLAELPEKVEEIAYCEMQEEQKKLYQQVIKEHHGILDGLKNKEASLNYPHIFALITKLKQIANHPASYLKDVENYQKYTSGKWELFKELLREIHESGLKAVVFSQYLDMLDIIEKHLKEHNIGYAAIRGRTKNRKEQVLKFQNDPECAIFVASLQAAGVGIDLVAASIVIHYDRWWNPAKENQATDRVHRMGQKRGVQVFKLVTKKTIEERIHQIIFQKLELTRDLVEYDDESQVKQLSREELLRILALDPDF